MKSLLLHVHDDHGQQDRISVALDLALAHAAKINCVQTLAVSEFLAVAPMSGFFPDVSYLRHDEENDAKTRESLKRRLRDAHAEGTWIAADDEPAAAVLAASRLSDLIILSRADNSAGEGAAPVDIVADVVVHARPPVLVVPPAHAGFNSKGHIAVAWNGTSEVAHSLRLTLPMLEQAASVVFVTVNDSASELPASEGQRYLAAHGIESSTRAWSCNGRGVAHTIQKAADELNASCIVMGAYGRSRMREMILGGVTRDLLASATVPLLLAH